MSTPTTTGERTVGTPAPAASRRSQEADLPPGQHFIDGAFRPGGSGTSIDVIDPSSERTIAQVAEGTAEDTDAAVAAAVARGARSGAALTPKERSEVLHRVADRVAENADLLARLESANTGKPSAVAQDDVAQTIDTFRFMAGALRAPTSAAAGRLRRGPPVGHPARAAGRHRGRDPVELPAADGRLEDGAHPGRRQHPGHQAVGADPAHHAEVRRARGRHPAGRRASTS